MHSKASRRYSLALYGLSEEKGLTEEVTKDITFAVNLITSNRDLELFFESPVIPKHKKLSVVKEIFGGKISKLTGDFINLLIERRRGGIAVEVLKDFIQLKKEKDGIVDVKVRTSYELDDREKSDMKGKIDSYTGLKGNMIFETDKSIIGGFVALIKDTVLDASIKRQLEILKNRFRQGDFELN